MVLESVNPGILSSFHYKTNFFSIPSETVLALSLRENMKNKLFITDEFLNLCISVAWNTAGEDYAQGC